MLSLFYLNYGTRDNELFCFEAHAREITEPFRKIRRRINDLRENVLYQWLHGYIQPSNLSSALVEMCAMYP